MRWLQKRSVFLASLALLACLFSSARANAQANDLFDAASKGDLPRVRALLDARADVNGKDNRGATALIYASYGGHVDVVRALLDAKADVNAKLPNGVTALYLASADGNADVVHALIDANSDVNVKARNGTTALIVASESGHAGTVRALLDAKADINAETDMGETALRLALRNGHDDIVEVLRKASGVDTASFKLIPWGSFGAYLASQTEINALRDRASGMTFSGYLGEGSVIVFQTLFVRVGATAPDGKSIGISVFTLGKPVVRERGEWVADLSDSRAQIYQYISGKTVALIRIGSEISAPQNEVVTFAGMTLRGGKIIVRTEGLELQPGTQLVH